VSNIEHGTGTRNDEMVLTSTFDIPCSLFDILIFAPATSQAIVPIYREGKSGQHRAMHR